MHAAHSSAATAKADGRVGGPCSHTCLAVLGRGGEKDADSGLWVECELQEVPPVICVHVAAVQDDPTPRGLGGHADRALHRRPAPELVLADALPRSARGGQLAAEGALATAGEAHEQHEARCRDKRPPAIRLRQWLVCLLWLRLRRRRKSLWQQTELLGHSVVLRPLGEGCIKHLPRLFGLSCKAQSPRQAHVPSGVIRPQLLRLTECLHSTQQLAAPISRGCGLGPLHRGACLGSDLVPALQRGLAGARGAARPRQQACHLLALHWEERDARVTVARAQAREIVAFGDKARLHPRVMAELHPRKRLIRSKAIEAGEQERADRARPPVATTAVHVEDLALLQVLDKGADELLDAVILGNLLVNNRALEEANARLDLGCAASVVHGRPRLLPCLQADYRGDASCKHCTEVGLLIQARTVASEDVPRHHPVRAHRWSPMAALELFRGCLQGRQPRQRWRQRCERHEQRGGV
mmetsp:Transcript_22590/g.57591  ORF Transcript_22590/g.57591 Transcript_22590/m.57591 type:complete len:469 (-) Transcript_22590:40-1446(-)